MSEERMSQQKMVAYLLGAVVVLLVVVIGILVMQNRAASTASLPPATNTPQGGIGGNTSGGNANGAPAGAFDPKVATKVPSGMEPKAYVEKYFKSIVKGDYKTAYEMLPSDKKAATTAEAFGEQLKGYGMNGFTMGQTQKNGEEVAVSATANTSGGSFGYTWTFVKDGKGGYLVKSRVLSGMGGN